VARTGRQPDRALRAFTFVASATVLGAAASGHHVSPRLVDVLDGLAAAGWLVLVPLAAVDLHRRRMDVLRDHAHGAWLVAAVATAGLAIAAADLAARGGGPGMLLAATALWLLALVLYLAIGALIAWRILARPLRPPMVTPDSWILMGALAITALAGDHLIAAGAGADWARWVVAVAGLLASALIPPLLFAELWRTDRVPGPLEYHTVWWAAVFPLGTYSAAADATARVLALPGLATVSLVFLWDAAAVWVLVAAGLAQRSLRAR
jgi:tellurite resistance protein TehA-like permease